MEVEACLGPSPPPGLTFRVDTCHPHLFTPSHIRNSFLTALGVSPSGGKLRGVADASDSSLSVPLPHSSASARLSGPDCSTLGTHPFDLGAFTATGRPRLSHPLKHVLSTPADLLTRRHGCCWRESQPPWSVKQQGPVSSVGRSHSRAQVKKVGVQQSAGVARNSLLPTHPTILGAPEGSLQGTLERRSGWGWRPLLCPSHSCPTPPTACSPSFQHSIHLCSSGSKWFPPWPHPHPEWGAEGTRPPPLLASSEATMFLPPLCVPRLLSASPVGRHAPPSSLVHPAASPHV